MCSPDLLACGVHGGVGQAIGQRVVEAQRGARAGCGVVVRHLEHLGDDSAQIQRGREARGVGGAGQRQ